MAKPFEEVVMDDVMSKAEQRALVYGMWKVMGTNGYGQVTITIEKGHPRRIETTDSETLPRDDSGAR